MGSAHTHSVLRVRLESKGNECKTGQNVREPGSRATFIEMMLTFIKCLVKN